MQKRASILGAFVVVAIAGAIVLGGAMAFGQPLPPGTTVIVFLPVSGHTPLPADAPTDVIVFTGGKVVDTALPGCATGTFPLQNAVLVDPGSQRSGRIVGLVVGSTDAVPPGTRVTGFSGGIPCTSNGTGYLKYTGTTE